VILISAINLAPAPQRRAGGVAFRERLMVVCLLYGTWLALILDYNVATPRFWELHQQG